MVYVVLTDEQARVVRSTGVRVELRDASGRFVGYAEQAVARDAENLPYGFTAEDIRLAKQRMNSDGPRLSTKQILEHLQSLEQE